MRQAVLLLLRQRYPWFWWFGWVTAAARRCAVCAGFSRISQPHQSRGAYRQQCGRTRNPNTLTHSDCVRETRVYIFVNKRLALALSAAPRSYLNKKCNGVHSSQTSRMCVCVSVYIRLRSPESLTPHNRTHANRHRMRCDESLPKAVRIYRFGAAFVAHLFYTPSAHRRVEYFIFVSTCTHTPHPPKVFVVNVFNAKLFEGGRLSGHAISYKCMHARSEPNGPPAGRT